MNRVWDYISFAVWFFGLGYIVMWLLRSPDLQLLPPALHVLGVASAMFVPVRLLFRTVSRRRSRQGAPRAAAPRSLAAVLRSPRRKPVGSLRSVKPRGHFGLRGTAD